MKLNKKQTILSDLKKQGARMTSVRSAVVEIFTKKKTPVSAGEILGELKKFGIRANKTTVYRELTFLVAGKIITPVSVDDAQKRYELVEEHHHHLVCQNCRRIEEVDFPEIEKLLSTIEKKLVKKKSFSKILHSLEFFGLCSKCTL